MNKHTINEKAFNEAYKIAVNKATALAPTLWMHLSDDEITKLKQDVYKAFLETYLEIDNN